MGLTNKATSRERKTSEKEKGKGRERAGESGPPLALSPEPALLIFILRS